jgi:site-specific DNA recombinase
MRVSAGDLEPVVVEQICTRLQRTDAATTLTTDGTTNVAAALAASRWAGQLDGATPSLQRLMLAAVVSQIAVEDGTIVIIIKPTGLATALGLATIDADDVTAPVIRINFRIARVGKQMKLVVKPDAAAAVFGDTPMIRLIAKSHAARQVWMKSRGKDDAAIGLQFGYSRAYLRTLLRVSFLAPDITALILDSRQPVGVGEHALMRATHLPIDWVGQRDMLGIG